MLQVVDHMEASCVLYVKVGMLDQCEQSKSCVLTVTKLGIVIRTVQDNSTFSVSVMYDPGDLLGQTSPDVVSIEE
jgi:hypothetical protein